MRRFVPSYCHRALLLALTTAPSLLPGQTAATASASIAGSSVVVPALPPPIVNIGGTSVSAPVGVPSINGERAERASDATAEGILLRADTVTEIIAAEDATDVLGIPGPTNTPDGWYHPLKTSGGFVHYLSSRNLDSGAKLKVDKIVAGGTLGTNLTGGANVANPGLNLMIGLWDGGQPRQTHQEFQLGGVSRVIPIDLSPPNAHATAVAGTLAAAGISSSAKGMAPEARIASSDSMKSIADMQMLGFNSYRVSNHSYGVDYGWKILKDEFGAVSQVQWVGDIGVSVAESHLFGSYSERSREIDTTVYNLPLHLPVWAVANSRLGYVASAARTDIEINGNNYKYFFTEWNGNPAYVCENVLSNGDDMILAGFPTGGSPPYQYYEIPFNLANFPANGGTSGYDTLTDYESAKNVLSVGGVDYNMQLTSVGSATAHGPTDDGRIKPDVVAKSQSIYTTRDTSDTAYTAYSGTSFASPAVAGVGHLLSQLREISWTQSPLIASSLKAVIIHTADDYVSASPSPANAAAGPDYRTGWGVVNAERAATLIRDDMAGTAYHNGVPQRPFIKEVNLADGQQTTWNVKAKGGEPLKVTVAWTDPSGNVQVAGTLDPLDSRLVNDLDLTVERLSDNTVFKPWRLDPANPAAPASNTYLDSNGNSIDNVEQVVTFGTTPAAGDLFKVTVRQKTGTTIRKADAAGNLSVGNQTVSIILSGIAANQGQPLNILSWAPVETLAAGSTPSSVRLDASVSAVVGQKYCIEKSSNLVTWSRNSDEVVARESVIAMSSYVTSPRPPSLYYRIRAISNFPNGIVP